ncbi:MAG: IclR family transcriptional regulator [Ruegeria sp.]
MSVIEKAIGLLSHFSPLRPEIGLSEFRRLSSHDKATTYRYLSALEAVGLVEKNPANKAYRIGPSVLRLAELREATVPRTQGVLQPLAILAEQTGESAHASVLSGTTLHSLAAHESTKHSTRVVIDVTILPLHATASGLAALAFGGQELREAALADMHRYTEQTPVSADDLDAAIARARETGVGTSGGTFEAGVHGMSVPVFDQSGAVAGAVSVASVSTRMSPEQERLNQASLIEAGRQITRNWGGVVPAFVDAIWTRTLASLSNKETTP